MGHVMVFVPANPLSLSFPIRSALKFAFGVCMRLEAPICLILILTYSILNTSTTDVQ